MNSITEISFAVQASSPRRFVNYCLDTLAYFVICLLLIFVSGLIYRVFELKQLPITFSGIFTFKGFMFWLFVWQSYYFFMELIFQRTIGKYITGTKIVTKHGVKPDSLKIFLRTIIRMVPLGVLSINENRLGLFWRDIASGIYVVNVKKYNEVLAMRNSFEQIGKDKI